MASPTEDGDQKSESHITNAGQRFARAAGEIAYNPSVYELIQEHISKIGVITQSFLCGCECVSGHEYVKDGKWMRPQISEQILWRLFMYSFENPGAPLSSTFMDDAV